MARSIFWIIAAILLFNSTFAMAGDFLSACRTAMSRSDQFLTSCQENAREFSRYFVPDGRGSRIKEDSKVWFEAENPNDHFVSGCVIDQNGYFRFFGVYYIFDNSRIDRINIDNIMSIDLNGEVVLRMDNKSVTLVPIQPFQSKKINTRWSNSGVPIDCEDSRRDDGAFHLLDKSIYVDSSKFRDNGDISIGYSDDGEKTRRFSEIPNRSSEGKIDIIYSWYNQMLITSEGSILVRSDIFDETCKSIPQEKISSSPLLLHQLCRIWPGSIENRTMGSN